MVKHWEKLARSKHFSQADIYMAGHIVLLKVIGQCCKNQFDSGTKLEVRTHNMLDRMWIEG